MSGTAGSQETFGVMVELRDESGSRPRLLSVFGIGYDRLVEKIVVPYQQGKPFKIGKHTVSSESIARIKVVRIPTNLDEQFRSIVIGAPPGSSQTKAPRERLLLSL